MSTNTEASTTIKPSDFQQESRWHFQEFYKNWLVYQIIKMMAKKNEHGNGDRWIPFTQRVLVANLETEGPARKALNYLDILADEDGIFDKTDNPRTNDPLETSFYSVNRQFFSVINPLT